MTIHKLPRPTTPDMQAIDDQALALTAKVDELLETLTLVHHTDKVFLQATVNSWTATKATLALAIRVDESDAWRDFER